MNMHFPTARFRNNVRSEQVSEIRQVAAFTPPADPFRIENDCLHPEGHDAKLIGRSFVCVNCSKVFGL